MLTPPRLAHRTLQRPNRAGIPAPGQGPRRVAVGVHSHGDRNVPGQPDLMWDRGSTLAQDWRASSCRPSPRWRRSYGTAPGATARGRCTPLPRALACWAWHAQPGISQFLLTLGKMDMSCDRAFKDLNVTCRLSAGAGITEPGAHSQHEQRAKCCPGLGVDSRSHCVNVPSEEGLMQRWLLNLVG